MLLITSLPKVGKDDPHISAHKSECPSLLFCTSLFWAETPEAHLGCYNICKQKRIVFNVVWPFVLIHLQLEKIGFLSNSEQHWSTLQHTLAVTIINIRFTNCEGMKNEQISETM